MMGSRPSNKKPSLPPRYISNIQYITTVWDGFILPSYRPSCLEDSPCQGEIQPDDHDLHEREPEERILQVRAHRGNHDVTSTSTSIQSASSSRSKVSVQSHHSCSSVCSNCFWRRMSELWCMTNRLANFSAPSWKPGRTSMM